MQALTQQVIMVFVEDLLFYLHSLMARAAGMIFIFLLKKDEMYNRENVQQLANQLIKEKQSLAVAESVTAGLMQLAFAGANHATSFFEGGITAYNLLQKWRLLQVDETHALTCNCVSPKVALEMAAGVRKMFKTDWGIGITGYAALYRKEALIACLPMWPLFIRNILF